MTTTTLLIIVLVVLLIGAIPNWHGHGPWPGGVLGVILAIIVVLALLGRL